MNSTIKRTLEVLKNDNWWRETTSNKFLVKTGLGLIEEALTPPTEEEVCEHLNKSFGLKGKNTTLHFIYDKESKEFRMVDEKNYVYRYISTKRVNEDAVELIDLDIDDIIILGRFYEGERK